MNQPDAASLVLQAEAAARLCLAHLPQLGPARARWLLSTGLSATALVDYLQRGQLPPGLGPSPPLGKGDIIQRWFTEARADNPEARLTEHQNWGAEVLVPLSPLWPFAEDPEPPLMVTAQGDSALIGARADGRPSVAIVGTRRCTGVGRRVAFEFGRELAEAGVMVVSGLASGIDAEAHRGALSGGGSVLGVVATGLDIVYPRRNLNLWALVADRGLLISEALLGTRPQQWRFPARNRLIAALADVVVVVESHDQGGSLHTVEEASVRGRGVMVVPGSVTSSASRGTNRLLAEGYPPACDVQDILTALDLHHPSTPSVVGATRTEKVGPPVSPTGSRILAEIQTGAAHIDDLVASAGVDLVELLAEIQQLVGHGLVSLDGSTVIPVSNHQGSDIA